MGGELHSPQIGVSVPLGKTKSVTVEVIMLVTTVFEAVARLVITIVEGVTVVEVLTSESTVGLARTLVEVTVTVLRIRSVSVMRDATYTVAVVVKIVVVIMGPQFGSRYDAIARFSSRTWGRPVGWRHVTVDLSVVYAIWYTVDAFSVDVIVVWTVGVAARSVTVITTVEVTAGGVEKADAVVVKRVVKSKNGM